MGAEVDIAREAKRRAARVAEVNEALSAIDAATRRFTEAEREEAELGRLLDVARDAARAERDAELEALDQRLAARIAELEAEAEAALQRARSERGTAAKERDKATLRYREARERLVASLPETPADA
ncbi:MAG: hypothetical protein VYE22_09725 [Myxococcota bacterium]|nr:hypothetical protein [Myxococcota bacterium]